MKFSAYAAVGAVLMVSAACSDLSDRQTRTLTGGAIGAGAGAGAVGGAIVGAPAVGAAVGGAVGAAAGALTGEENDLD